MPDWYMALVGAERLRVPFSAWIGMGWQAPPECVKQWTFARIWIEAEAEKGREAIRKRQDKKPA